MFVKKLIISEEKWINNNQKILKANYRIKK